MADQEWFFDGKRRTWFYKQTPGKKNVIYPWAIYQSANGAIVKLTEEQMKGIVDAYLEAMKDAQKEKTNPV